MLFTRGGRKSGESPGFDFKIRKEFRPVSVERRATAEREEGRGRRRRLPRVAERGDERREAVGKEGGGERREKN